MAYLVHTAHAQLGALWLSCVGWILTAVALGLIQWRVWLVLDREVVSSGVAWVGVWRACFNSHTVVSEGFQVMYCQSMGLTEAFTPPEVAAGQVLMLLSVLAGLCGNAGGVYSMRNVYFGVQRRGLVRRSFLTTGVLCLLAAGTSLVPLLWNLCSVKTNQTIRFPPRFKLPPAPAFQHVGSGIMVGMVGAILMIVSGVVFCTYKLPVSYKTRTRPSVSGPELEVSRAPVGEGLGVRAGPSAPVGEGLGVLTGFKGKDNPAFILMEN